MSYFAAYSLLRTQEYILVDRRWFVPTNETVFFVALSVSSYLRLVLSLGSKRGNSYSVCNNGVTPSTWIHFVLRFIFKRFSRFKWNGWTNSAISCKNMELINYVRNWGTLARYRNWGTRYKRHANDTQSVVQCPRLRMEQIDCSARPHKIPHNMITYIFRADGYIPDLYDLYGLCDLCDLYDLPHDAGREPYNLHDLFK